MLQISCQFFRRLVVYQEELGLEFWNKCSEKLENKLSQEDFNTWIRPLKGNLNKNTLEIVAPNDFILNYVETNLSDEIMISSERFVSTQLRIKSLGATISKVFLFKLPLRGLIQVLKSSCESLFSSFSEHLFQNSNPSSS